jgi:hypothetical protein
MNKLLYIINKVNLQLLISPDIIMWEVREQSITINLIFSLADLKQKIISYYINLNLKSNLDHHSIFT